MEALRQIESKEKIQVTGRGTILIVPLTQFTDLPDRIYDDAELKKYLTIGQRILSNNVQYQILGLEMRRCLMDPPFIQKSTPVGVVVREIKEVKRESCAICNEEFPITDMEELVDSDKHTSYVCKLCWNEDT